MESTHIQHICKHGASTECCRYLIFGAKGFECHKVLESKRTYRDRLVKEEKIIARGDNCPGKYY